MTSSGDQWICLFKSAQSENEAEKVHAFSERRSVKYLKYFSFFFFLFLTKFQKYFNTKCLVFSYPNVWIFLGKLVVMFVFLGRMWVGGGWQMGKSGGGRHTLFKGNANTDVIKKTKEKECFW